ncbi:hypothetical protein GCM10011400_64120 [Paraburkholderia caffeinilytica]|uniref:Porin n=2 Tax=Paraburkholderia caffeinilytica TaxID=1761016 RepID=A0ABQ1NBT1_9BURK|nr:hypothetical protein GCM10011400_64120 [Paraburkholderia caffeinilytica]CAB3804203.1 hypothetical protein LMG28690_05970 [Paraburkholderia caffeinilytica]
MSAFPVKAAEPAVSTDVSQINPPVAAVPESAATPDASASSAARAYALDAKYGYKGWIVPFPSYGDTLALDYGNWRTKLAEYGFGFSIQGSTIFQDNLLNTPSRIPSSGFAPCGPNSLNYNCAGGRSYFGQRPSVMFANSAFLTYDMSQHGIPDGQIAVGTNFGVSNDQQYNPNTARLNSISWYQTLLDKKLEIKAGYFANLPEFAGTFVGGLVVNPFGPSSSVPIVLGMSPNSISTPNFRIKWNVTNTLYAQTAIQRSLPVNGPTGNSIYDEVNTNPTGFRFTSSVPGTRVLSINEFGYKRPSSPDAPFTWLRAGFMYNNSTFPDYSRMLQDPHATKNGSYGLYLLGDYQVTQSAPGSPYTAYRGMYVGGSFMYGDPKSTPFTQYYEARAYWVGPFASRPTDLLSFVYSHNKTSRNVQSVINNYTAYTNFFAISGANSITASYTYHVMPGLYATAGLGYTDKPSLSEFRGEGNALNVLLSLYWII